MPPLLAVRRDANGAADGACASGCRCSCSGCCALPFVIVALPVVAVGPGAAAAAIRCAVVAAYWRVLARHLRHAISKSKSARRSSVHARLLRRSSHERRPQTDPGHAGRGQHHRRRGGAADRGAGRRRRRGPQPSRRAAVGAPKYLRVAGRCRRCRRRRRCARQGEHPRAAAVAARRREARQRPVPPRRARPA